MTLLSQYQRAQQERDLCRLSHHPDAYWAIKVFSDQSRHFAFWCDRCRGVTQERYPVGGPWVSYEKAFALSGVDPNTFLVVESEHRYNLCVHCRATIPCEQHHIAPRKFFPDHEAWPTLPLCPPCHREWHRVLTPGLSTAYDPDYHATMLRSYLTTDNLRDLWKAVQKQVGGGA